VHDASVRQPAAMPPAARPFSILPAAIVLVLAVLTLGSFAVVDLWVSPSTTATTLPNIVGTLRVDPSTPVFGGWRSDGLPPTNIASALLAPVGAIYVHTVPTGGSPGVDYDNEVRLSVPAPRAKLLGFYRANLEALGWQLFSTGPAHGGGDQLIFEKGGTNGDYWDAGVIAQATVHGHTIYVFRLFDVGDNE
jgi:hypothetical protein